MKNKILKGIFFGILTSSIIGCNQKKEEPVVVTPAVNKDEIKAELQVMENAYTKALNERNIDNLVYYADDAVSFSQNEPAMVGKPAIEQSLKENLASFAKGRTVAFTVRDIFPSDEGKLVVEVGNYKVVDSMNVVKNSGNYISVFEKRNGKYLCVRDMSATDMKKEEKK